MINAEHAEAQRWVIRAEHRAHLADLAAKQRRRYHWQQTITQVLTITMVVALFLIRQPIPALIILLVGAALTIGNTSRRAGLPSAAEIERERLEAATELAVAKNHLTHLILKGHP